MKLFVALADDDVLLPHFVSHYRKVGVTRFFVGTAPELGDRVRRLALGDDVVVRVDPHASDSLFGGTTAVTKLRREFAGPDEWVMIADLDEFAELGAPVNLIVEAAEAAGANVVRARMIDRVAADGSLAPILPDSDLWSLFPRTCALTSRLQGAVDYKGLLIRGHLTPSMAHHEFADERVYQAGAVLHHFKWNANARRRIQTVTRAAKERGISWWTEYERALTHIEQHGRIKWEDYVTDGSVRPHVGGVHFDRHRLPNQIDR